MPEPKFELFRDKAGKFRFRLLAANGEIIATGEGFESKEALINSIESVKKNAPVARIVEVRDHQAWKKKPSRSFGKREGKD